MEETWVHIQLVKFLKHTHQISTPYVYFVTDIVMSVDAYFHRDYFLTSFISEIFQIYILNLDVIWEKPDYLIEAYFIKEFITES